ncbi:hypothetical protein BC834DRAFT_924820 [Gloeopeniophorella convolvens]|nr:hypothetical protein BC834DRAFT_924820 [Gloeopeniophorella convolvens]
MHSGFHEYHQVYVDYQPTTYPRAPHSSSTSSSPSTGFNASSVSLPFNVALQPGIVIYEQSLYSGQAQFAALPAHLSPTLRHLSTAVHSYSHPISGLQSRLWLASNRIVIWDSVPDMSQLPGLTSLSLSDIQSNACSPQCSGAGICSASGQFCASGFFGSSCQACPAGCSKWMTGSPCSCNAGWTTASNGTQCASCAPGFFLDGNGNCAVCQLGCQQCADGSGICVACKQGFTQDANDRTKCDAVQSITNTGTQCTTCQLCCPSKCTSCGIPNFSAASTINELQCKGCLPGFVLSNGSCVESCPSGTFLSPQDNLTCTACSSQCGTCAGAADFCLTCNGNQLASGGKCVSTCPSNTITAAGACAPCHPDCATCSGTSFNQCSSCPPNRPVLSNGRCLPTCSKSQFFDRTSGTCQPCDGSCSSCSASGPSNCLACSSSTSVLRGGTCSPANCSGNGAAVVPGLGVCLSDLVSVPQVSGTTPSIPLPSITGINTPAVTSSSGHRALAWWEILLMALGCAFIFICVLALFRRRARKQRAQRTAAFAAAKNIDARAAGWRGKLAALFSRGPRVPKEEKVALRVARLRNLEAERHAAALGKLGVAAGGSSALPQHYPRSRRLSVTAGDTDSFYSQVTGLPPRAPPPRQPVSVRSVERASARYSGTTVSSLPMTEAQRYAKSVEQDDSDREGAHWFTPAGTGGGQESQNPFRK